MEYAEIEDKNVEDIDRKMKELISDEAIFEEYIEKIEWNPEAVAVENTYSPDQIVFMAYANIKNAGYIKMIVENGLENQGLRKLGATSRLTSIGP